MIKTAFRTCIAALAMAPIASTGLAQTPQTPPPPRSDDIVVTGSRVTSREIEKVALSVTAPGDLYRQPLARFEEPICPGVSGMSAEIATAINARIRYVAERARIRVARPDKCAVNLLVIFLPSGQLAMQNLLHNGAWLFGTIHPSELQDLAEDPALKDLAADPGPVHAWVNTQTVGRDGQVFTGRGFSGEPSLLKTSGGHSHIFVAARQEIMGSVVVIDSDAVIGMPVSQIADYAAMRGLARTRPPAQSGAVGTILTLFDKGAVPPLEMTRFDLAYLRAAYSWVPNVAGISKIARVALEVKKAANEE